MASTFQRQEQGGSHSGAAARSRPSVGLDLLRLHSQLVRTSQAASDRQQLWKEMASALRAVPGIQLIAWYSNGEDRAGEEAACQVVHAPVMEPQGPNSSATDAEFTVAEEACRTGLTVVRPHVDPSWTIVAVPIARRRSYCLLATFHGEPLPTNASIAALHDAAAQIGAWELVREKKLFEDDLGQLAALMELTGRVESAATLKQACVVLANELRVHLQCRQVIVGVCTGKSKTCQIKALSDQNAFDTRAERTRFAQSALQESVARGGVGLWPAVENEHRHALLAHRQFAEASDSGGVVSSPLRTASGEICGAILIVFEKSANPPCSSILDFVHGAETPLGCSLHLIRRAEKSPLQKAWDKGLRWLGKKQGIAVVACFVLTALLMATPITYQPICDCVLEPVTRRFASAPFDGPLKEALVRPGDVVSANQTLAIMDERETRWQLAGAQAELHRAQRERAGELASHDFAKAQLAKHEVDRIRQKIELLEHRMRHLEIRSPIDGVVVNGDLHDSVGAPLSIGETMFELAPLGEMIVELAVSEDDLASTQTGMPVEVTLAAFPFRRFKGQIGLIHPRAELIDGRNVFVAEVRLANEHELLLPGMKGHGRVTSKPRSIGWILFRRPYAAALSWLGW